MVVDDDPIIVKYIVRIAQDNGYETCSANDGIEAYTRLQEEKPDLITLDLQMTEEWGPQFYRRLAKEEEYKHIPIIVISGLASRHLSIRKAVAYLAKPFDPVELITIIQKTIGK